MITRCIEKFISRHPERGKAFVSLGQLRYLSLLKHAELMVGNSSSGLIEAPSFHLPVVNIGTRQQGRIRAHNVIDVIECQPQPIMQAIEKALTHDFKISLSGIKNPYGQGNASEKIVETLKTVILEDRLLTKSFYEICSEHKADC